MRAKGARGPALDISVDAAREVTDRVGTIDILVNSAGVALLAPAEELAFEDWMLGRGYGRIINISSQGGHVALDGNVAHNSSKAPLYSLTKTLASEWGGRGVTVNSLSPTVVLTPLGEKAWAGAKGEAHKAEIPAGRFAYPDEIAAAIIYLASDAAAMVNGADLRIDGGFTIR